MSKKKHYTPVGTPAPPTEPVAPDPVALEAEVNEPVALEAEVNEPVALEAEVNEPIASETEDVKGTEEAKENVKEEAKEADKAGEVETVRAEAFVLPHSEAAPEPEPHDQLPPETHTNHDAAPESVAGHPAQGIQGEVAQSFAGKLFNALALLGPLVAVVFLFAQTAPGLMERAAALFGADLAMHDAYVVFKQGLDPLLFVTTTDGALPPAYFWFLAGLESAWQFAGLPLNMPLLILGGTATSAALLLIVGWILARTLGCNLREALAANMVLLTTLAFADAIQFATPDLLFAACISASCICLYTGWIKNRAPLALLFGFLLAGLAVLVNGETGVLLPLGASLLFLLWRGTFRRAGARDGAFAFLLMLAGLGGWLAWLGLTYGRAPLAAFVASIFGRWGNGFSLSALPLNTFDLGLTLLPWTLLALFLPWERIYRIPVHLWRDRQANPGVGFAWCVVLVGLLALICGVAPFTLLMGIAPFMALLTGRAVMALSPGRSRLYFGLLGIGLFLLAIVLGASSLLPVVQSWIPADVAAMFEGLNAVALFPGVIFTAAAALLFSFILLKITDKRYPGGALLILLLSVTAMVVPLNLLTLPHLAALPISAPAEAPPAEITPAPAVPAPAMPAPAEIPPAETAPTPTETTPATESPATESPATESPATESSAPRSPAPEAPAVPL